MDYEEALEQVDRIVQCIDDEVPEEAKDRAGEFFEAVREKVIAVGETINRLERVTAGQQRALDSWEAGVRKWVH